MSKRHQKNNTGHLKEDSSKIDVNSAKSDHNFVLEIVIGSSNVKRWNQLKITFSCTTNEELATFLLDIAQKYIKENSHKVKSTELPEVLLAEKSEKFNVPEIISKTQRGKNASQIGSQSKIDRIKRKRSKTKASYKAQIQEETEINTKEQIILDTSSDCVAENVSSENLVCSNASISDSDTAKASPLNSFLDNSSESQVLENIAEKELNTIKSKENSSHKHRRKNYVEKHKSNKPEKHKKRSSNYDIRKAPELNEQVEVKSESNNVKNEVRNQRVAIKIKLCCTCGTRHIQEHCPLQNPHYTVKDSVSYDDWIQKYKPVSNKYKQDNIDEKITDKDDNFTFAYLSLPHCLYLSDSNGTAALSVFSRTDIKEFTQFGPLLGKIVKEVDIPEDFDMQHLWEIFSDKSNIYVNSEDLNESNWIRFVRPASTRDERNVVALSKSDQLFLVTIKNISAGEELLYWQDDVLAANRKKMEKTTCGGCNMTFAHPLYYRIHCSIFHDMRYSLTIRKYHCKICGAAVLGKENIMKHAAELHNGQGAYQCQFCKKYFLRLNYLEMHRTYGCSANPHRSRPLCDFCGRKFCQPQKLKVHIKRMHSDLAEVLKEFQCKNCLKLLGSRAALQRHVKEVHNKQGSGVACACSRCGKLFQNKSNLKIHMLTHSGIKPFKCSEGTCNAAFTTKQCLQFHYKKVHGFTDDIMPKIKRSVDYTFEAYSGVEDQDNEADGIQDSKTSNNNTEFGCLNDDSDDIDDDNDDDDDEDYKSVEDRNLDDPPSLHSPVPITTENSSASNQSPPTLEPYTTTNLKILSKGSKKWLGEQPLQPCKTDIYQLGHTHPHKIESTDITLDIDETQTYERAKLSMNLNPYSRHESSNASLLVEAALDSVTDIHCSDSNINIDVDSTPNGADALVNNLCTLAHPDPLSDVPYSHSVDIAESRDINLISPSVNDTISVTEGENMGISYSNFHHNDFSPTNSPGLQQRPNFNREYIDVSQISPQDVQNYNSQSKSPCSSPPRYNFGHGISNEHVSSDDSNGMSAQNLSLHSSSKNNAQLDLSIYKSPYNMEATNFQFRKDFGMKLNLESERKQVYVLEINEAAKMYHENALNDENNLQSEVSDRDQVENFESNVCTKDFESIDSDEIKHKNTEFETALRSKYDSELSPDVRNKPFDIDLNLRTKGYEIVNDSLRPRNSYDGTIDSTDFRVKAYDTIDNMETTRNNLIESEFRIDRNFEPLVLNSTELQGLDMSARSYHNYHSSASVQNLNRYHHLYPDVERPSVDLRLNYSPPLPPYTHTDVLRVVSLDLTSPGRHSVDLSLRSNPLHMHQLGNSRLLSDHSIQTNRILADSRLTLDQSRLLTSELSTNRHLSGNSRLLSVTDTGNRILSDHSTNRLLSNDQLSTNHIISSEQSRLITDETRLISDQPRLLEQGRLLTESRILSTAAGSGTVSPIPYPSYSVSPTPYHPTALTSRSHTNSPSPSPYPHHYSSYY